MVQTCGSYIREFWIVAGYPNSVKCRSLIFTQQPWKPTCWDCWKSQLFPNYRLHSLLTTAEFFTTSVSSMTCWTVIITAATLIFITLTAFLGLLTPNFDSGYHPRTETAVFAASQQFWRFPDDKLSFAHECSFRYWIFSSKTKANCQTRLFFHSTHQRQLCRLEFKEARLYLISTLAKLV